jgi:Carboxypeptidase regulatory-like domain
VRVVFASVLCLAVVSGVHAFQNVDSAAPKKGTIHGHIVESASGDPVRKVTVILRRDREPGIGAISDATGAFVFSDLDPGAYMVSVERTGFVLDPDSERVVANVQPEPAVSEISLKLIRTGAISGRVFDSEGDPVTGAAIQIMPAGRRKGTAPQFTNVVTNDRGEYRFFGIMPGPYRIAVSYQPRPEVMQVKMQPSKNPDGRPPEDTYALTYYPGALDPKQSAVVNVEAGSDLQGFDVRVLRARGVTVRGKISGVSPGAVVILSLTPTTPTPGSRVNDTMVQSADGSYELPMVLPGTYGITATAALNARLSARRIIDVGESDIGGIELRLAPPQTITGTVVLPEGRQMAGSFVVMLIPRESRDNRGGGMAHPGEKGAFQMADVSPGDYDLVAGNVGPGDDLYVSAIRMQDEDVLEQGIHVGSQPLAPLKVTLQANGGALQLDVLDGGQKPVPDAYVRLVPDPPRRGQRIFYSDCRTSAEGTCTVLGVAPGKYHAFALLEDRQVDFRDPAAAAEIEDSGKAVEIFGGERKTVELTPVPHEN